MIDLTAQLYIFSKLPDLAVQMPAILRTLSEAGYASVETMFGQPPATHAEALACGIVPFSTHLSTPKLPDALPVAQALGVEDVCVSGPLVWTERSGDDFRRTAQFLNAQETGLRVHYHNHEFEFENHAAGIDALLEELDPERVSLCFDAGWAWLAGADPVAFIEKHAPRIGVLHLRDFRGTTSVPLGQGEIDLHPILAALPHLPNLRCVAVEQDPTTETPLEDMVASLRYLQKNY